MNATQQNLKAALELLGPNGENWIKGRTSKKREDGTYAYCSDGAILEAINASGWVEGAYMGATGMLTDASQELAWVDYVEFNDDEYTEFTDIKRLFERAIELAEES